MLLCIGQNVAASRWTKAADVAHFIPSLILNPSFPQPAIITSRNEPLPVFQPLYALLDSLYFPLFMNLTELLHFMHLQLAVLSV